MSAVQLLKLRACLLWRVSFKLLLGRRFGLQNGRKLLRFLMLGTAKLGISRPNEKGFIRLHSRIILVELSRSWGETYGVSYKKGTALNAKTNPIFSNLTPL